MRIRLTFHKTAAMRYTGHLDLQRAWERLFRRARLPLAYSSGFHPQARLNLACALPLGFTSQCELLDAWLISPQPLETILTALVEAAPPGIEIIHLEEITERLPALQTQVTAAVFTITLLDFIPDLDGRVNNLINSPSLPRVRRGKDYNLRPLVEAIALLPLDEDGHQRIHLQLSAREASTGRPEEVLAVLDIALVSTRVHRTALILRPG